MAVYSGKDGVIKANTENVANVRSFSLDATSETQDSTSMPSGWRTHAATIKSWSGSLEAWWDPEDEGQIELALGDTVALELYPTGSSSGDTKLSGNAIITSKPIKQDVGGLIEVSFAFLGTGALTEATVSP